MYKKNIVRKIVLFFLITSPLLFVLFVGYPIISADPNWSSTHPFITQRCFKIGDFDRYLRCLFEPYAKLRGSWLIKLILTRLNYVHPFFSQLFVGALLTTLLLVIFLI